MVFTADAVESHPGQHTVVVTRVGRPSHLAAVAVQGQTVPSAEQHTLADSSGAQFRAEMWATARSDDQSAVPVAPRNEFDARDLRDMRAIRAHRAAVGEHIPVSRGRRWDLSSAALMSFGCAAPYVGRCWVHETRGITCSGQSLGHRCWSRSLMLIVVAVPDAVPATAVVATVRGWARCSAHVLRRPTAAGDDWPRSTRWWPPVPSARPAGRSGSHRRRATGQAAV